MTSQDYALQAVKGIKKSFDNAVKNKLEEYMDNRVFDFYNTSEVFEIYTSTEGLNGSRKLAELETPPVLALEDGYTVTITENRFGGAIILSEKMWRRDGADATLKVDSYLMRQRNQLLKDNVNLLLTEAFTFLNFAFATTYYAAPDAAVLCGSHTWSTGTTFDNGITAAFTESEVDTALEYAGAFTDASGKPMPLNFDTIIVKKGSPNARLAKKLFAFGITPAHVADINIYEGTFKIVEVPYITSAKKAYWFMRDSSLDNSLKVGIGAYPAMRDPIRENNEAIRSNVTGFWKQGIVNMPFDWYGSDGTV